jgi:tetratricopeptide (TPR) repeat protein
MTAPNHQSLEGTERVARAITGASTEARAGRGRLRTWLSVSRVPSVDESYLADLWFTREDNQTWFDRGIELGLWSREDHHKGLRSHEIPYRARFGFDEALLSELAKIDPRDSLALAYEHLTGTLLTWLRGQPPIRLDLSDKPSVDIGRTSSVEDLRALATGAERRGDALGLALILHFLALALHESGHVDEAIRKVEQASGIYMSRGLRQEYGSSLLSLGLFLCTGSRLEEAEEAFLKVRGLARELTDTQMEARALNGLALVHVQRGVDKRSGLEFLEESDRLTRTFNPERRDPSLLALMGQVSHSLGNTKGAQEAMRQSMAIYRSLGDVTHEKIALSTILGFLDANQESEDAAELRARLEQLEAKAPADE